VGGVLFVFLFLLFWDTIWFRPPGPGGPISSLKDNVDWVCDLKGSTVPEVGVTLCNLRPARVEGNEGEGPSAASPARLFMFTHFGPFVGPVGP